MTKRNFHFFRLEDRVLLSGEGLDPTLEMIPDGDAMADLQSDVDALQTDLDAIEAAVLAAAGEALPNDTDDRPSDVEISDIIDPATDIDSLDPARPIEVIFIDAGVEDSESLIAGLRDNGENGTQWVLVHLESDSNGIEQITSTLSSLSSVDAIHLLSHGDGAGVQLGNVKLDQETSLEHAGDIASWGHALDNDADMLIYGCDLASTTEGQDLIEMLALVCNCDVAASDDATGHADLGGDWILEYSVGDVTTEVAFGFAAQASWFDTLATITVTTTDDENDGNTSNITALEGSPGGTGISLREAIIAANNTAGADTIVLGAGTYVLDITGQFENASATGDLDVTSQITITGDRLDTTILDASSLGDRIFYIANAGVLTISDMTLTGASSGTEEGAAVYNEGNFSATDVAFTNNTVGNVGGGAIYSRGTTTLDRTSLIGNTSGASGGAIHVYNGTTTITNSTISGNTTEYYGGGIYAENAGSTVNIVHSTIADNTVLNTNGYGGGVYATAATVNTEASIFADNTSNLGGSDINGTIVSGGYNIIEHNSGFSGTVGTDIVGSDPSLAALSIDATSGQSVHAIDNNSIAYNAATSSTTVEDQRGVTRDGTPDIGAYEYEAPPELLAHYQFDSGSGATDSSGNGLDGVLQGDASVDTTSGTNQVGDGKLTLDGTGDYVDLSANVGSFSGLSSGTIAAWVKLSTSGFSTIFDMSDGATSNFASLWVENGNLIWAVSSGGTALMRATSTATINDDTWHHVAVTTNGSGTKLYIDGVHLTGGDVTYSQGDATTTTFLDDLAGASSVKLGAYDTGSVGGEFTGLIDDARVYTSALNDSDMTALYAYRSETPTDLAITETNDGGLSINEDGGNDAYLIAEDGLGIPTNLTKITYEVQFSATQTTSLTPLISYATGADSNEFMVSFQDNGNLHVFIGDHLTSSAIDYRTITDGTQHSLALTWDSSGGDWKIFVDGLLVDSGTGFATGNTIDSGGTLVFGHEQDSLDGGYSSGQLFSGKLFDARVFDDVRTESEIAQSYRSELPHDEANLIANWRFDDLSSNGIATESVSGNNLTVKHVAGGGFTNSNPTLTLSVNENAAQGTVIGFIDGSDLERTAKISSLLAADADLRYSAETGKFYKLISTTDTWVNAQSSAIAMTLGGVSGQLLTIDSAAENELATSYAITAGGHIWLGYSDQVVEGEFREYTGTSAGRVIWRGTASGTAVDGVYTNWQAGEPNDSGGSQDFGKLYTTGTWDDEGSGSTFRSVVEWDADAVLDNDNALTYSIQSQTVPGAFAINASTGTITVADGSLLDYETNATHSLTVRVSDVDSNTYDEVFTISLNDLVESNNAPTDLSSGIELNADGGNDAYLVADDGGAVLAGLSQLTYETTFQAETNTDTILVSYASTSTQHNDFLIELNGDGTASMLINGSAVIASSIDYNSLMDGETHHLAFSWDNTNGNWALYVDGDLTDSGSGLATGQTLRGTAGTSELVFGQEQDDLLDDFDSSQIFSGTIYDVRIWNEVRSQTEISLNYQNKISGGSIPSGLIANWQMDGFNGFGEVVDIVSGNNLSVGHATGPGFIASTPVEDLHIAENSADGTTVGYAMPSDPDVSNDIVSDGLFTEASPSTSQYGVSGTFGDWTVSRATVDLFSISDWQSPLGGRVVNLDGSAPGTIEQTLTTVAGQQYQVVFSLSGDFSGGEAVKNLRVSASGTSANFEATQTSNWSWGETGAFEQRSFTFTADGNTSLLQFHSLEGASSTYGPYIADIQVIEIPAAVTAILDNDASLSYDAGTGKFYRAVNSSITWSAAQTAALNAGLNGIQGELVTIESQYENDLIVTLSQGLSDDAWLGASDQDTEGTWKWYDGANADETFWIGDAGGTAQAGLYTNWSSIEPNDSFGEDFAEIKKATGKWNDLNGGGTNAYIIQWNADEVLSNFTFSLTDDAGGRFAINESTGEITVANGTLLNYEAANLHSVVVQTTDAMGNSYNESMTIAVDDANDAPVMSPYAPTYNTTEDAAAFSANVSALLGSSVTDADTGAVEGIAVYGQTGSTGTLEFSINGGSSWQTFSSLSETNATLLRATDLFRFTPDGVSGGTMTLDYYAWDQTDGTAGSGADVSSRGGTTAYSTTDDTVTINVSDINDEQTVSTNDGATFDEGSSVNTITSAMLETTDIDNTASELTYSVTGSPSHGQLMVDGIAATTFTQADINAGRVTYNHDDSENFSDSFSFSVDDGAGAASTGSFSITLNPINDNAVAITSDGGGATASLNVNETVSFVTQVTVSDADMPGDTMTYSIIGGTDQADFTIDSSGNLTFASPPDYENPDDSDLDNVYEVTVQVSDGVHTDSQTITVTVLDVQSTALNVTTTSDVDDTGLGATYTIEELYAVGGGTDGEISLREAIIAANNTLGQDTINFEILNSDAGYSGTAGIDAYWQISLTAALPTITESVILDGTSQTTFGGNVNPGTLGVVNEAGTNAQAISDVERPEIAIVGASGFSGIVIGGDNVTVQGFSMYGFSSGAAIYINDAVQNTFIDSNVLGVTPTGITDPGAALNNQIHVQSVGADNGTLSNNILAYSKSTGLYASNGSDGWSITGNQFIDSGYNYSNGDAIAMNGSIGGSIDGNYFTGSSTQAIILSGSSSGITISDNTIVGNGVGPVTGSHVQYDAIALRNGTNNITLTHNIIAENYGAGILVNDGAFGIEITENSIYGNGNVLSRQGATASGIVGIDLQGTGENASLGTAPYYTANDVGDADTGGNSLQNFPVITQAISNGSQITILGSFNSVANETFTIEFFTSESYANGYGQGQTFVGSISVTTDGSGNATFNYVRSGSFDASEFITATATNDSTKETSEFAAQVAINGPVYANQDDGHLEFDGTDDYVAIASSPELTMSNTMTMEAWVRPDASANTDRMILNKEGEYELSVDADGSIKWAFANSDPGWAWHDTNYTLTDGEWAHVAVSYNNGTVSTYVNGELIEVYEGSGTIGDSHPTLNELHIGGRSNNPTGQYFQGGIDDVRVWNVVRSQAEIRDGIDTPPTGSETGLVGYYQFNGSGTTVVDASGDGNHGTLGGGVGDQEPTRFSYIINEDSTLSVLVANGLLANDVDTDDDPLTITEINGNNADIGNNITLPSGATIQLEADGSFSYVPGPNYQYLTDGETATETFSYTVSDGNGNTDTTSVTITIVGVNDAPVLDDNYSTAFDAITEDDIDNSGQSVASILSSSGQDILTDADDDPEGIAIVASNPGNGVWEYSTNGGSSWTGIGSVSDANALLLQSTDLVRFNPNGELGTTASISFRGWDETSGTAGSFHNITATGGDSAFSSNTESAAIVVGDRNDAPVLDNTGDVTLTAEAEDSGAPVGSVGTVITDIVSLGGNVTDVDTGAQIGIAVTAADTTNGTWWYTIDSGSTWNALGSVSDSSARVLNANSSTRVYFEANANYTGTVTDAITFRAWDRTLGPNGSLQDASTNGGITAFSSATESADITINSVNDAPVLDDSFLYTLSSINEDETSNGGQTVASILSSNAGTGITDVDASAVEGIAIRAISSSSGHWEYSLNGGTDWSDMGTLSTTSSLVLRDTDLVRFIPDETNGEQSNLTFVAWDQTDGSTAGTKVNSLSTGGTTAFSSEVAVARITVTDVNDAPTLTDAATINLGETNEDTDSVASSVASILASAGGNDVDSSPLSGLAVTSTTGNGTWQYSTDGTNWTDFGTVSTNNALLLTSTSEVRYSPDGIDGETATFGFLGWDQTVSSGSSFGSPSLADPTGKTGGTNEFSDQTATASILVTSINDAVIAVADTGAATEAGGIANATAGSDATGNVLSNDNEIDPGDILNVTGVATGTVASADTNVATSVTGTYGSITVAANGNYTYVVDENNAIVQSLRTSGDTITDTFTYTVTDSGGATSSTQIVVTIHGQNDAPVALADNATAVEGGGLNNADAGTNPTGNVLTNDTDVDAGDTKTVTGSVVGAATGAVGASVAGTYGSITINADGSYSYIVDNSNAAVEALRTSSDTLDDVFTYTITDTDGATSSTQITVTIEGQNDDPNAIDDNLTAVESGGVSNATAGSDGTGNVLSNDTDKDAADTKTVIGVVSGSQSVASGNVGTGVAGAYGTLTIDATGNATFVVDENNAAVQSLRTVGDTLSEVFTYTIIDTAGADATAEVTVTITGQNDAPVAVANAATAIEASGMNNNVSGTDPSGNVLTNDTDLDGSDTKTVVGVDTGIQATTSGSVGVTVMGTYGEIVINSDGSYTYTLDNDNAAVDALLVGESLSETFSYTMQDTAGLQSTTQIAITIDGRTDLPVAESDMATAVEAGGLNNASPGSDPSGNVLANDAANNGKVVVGVDAGITALATGDVGTEVVGTYGSVVIDANGDFTYTLDNDNPAVEALRTSGEHVTDVFTYSMEDNDSNSSTTQLTITVDGNNDVIIAVADIGTAVESGGLNNGTAGSNATGNLITNDIDVDSGDTKSVVGVQLGTQTSTSGSVGASVAGNYGHIVINNDGSYTYTIDESLSAVQALRTTSDTLTETYSYTVTDTAGTASTTQIVITIQGGNDTPTAVVDEATAYEAGGVTNATPGTDPTGNVLDNDTDVDSGDTKTVVGVAAGTTGSAAGNVNSPVVGIYGSITIAGDGSYAYAVDNDNSTVQALRTSGQFVTDTFTYTFEDTNGLSSTTQITVTVRGTNDAIVATADNMTATEAGGTANDTAGTNPTMNVLTNDTDVDAGDTKAVSGVAAGNVGSASGSVGASVAGQYGNIQIASDGTATYTVDNSNTSVQALLNSSDTLTDVFTYTVHDTNGLESTTQVTVTIEGANDAPVAIVDAGIADESGGVSNATAGNNATGNVLTNDNPVDTGDTHSVTGLATGVQSSTTGGVGSGVVGTYGTMNIDSAGNYSYVIDETNTDVEALRTSSDTLSEVFSYTTEDAAGLSSTSQITITIRGANDNPVAIFDTAIAIEAGGVGNGTAGTNPSGNVLTNDTDVDSLDTKNVAGVVAGVAGSATGNVGSDVTGTYGSIHIDANGDYTYTTDNNNAAVEALRNSSETLDDVFTYTTIDAAGSTSTTQITVTIQGSNDEPIISVEAGDSAAESISETDTTLTTTGTLTVTDLDLTDSVTSTVSSVVAGGTTTGLASDNAALLAMLTSTTNVLDSTEQSDKLNWNFNSASETFNYLAVGESLTLTYTITVTDIAGTTDTQNVIITINGTNDAPDLTIGGGSAAVTLTETDTTLSSTGTLTVDDLDLSDNVTSTVSSVVAGGTTAGMASDNAALLAMLTSTANVIDGTELTDTLTWNFNSASEAFDHLAVGESLTLTYTITVTDSQGVTDTQNVLITINGTNDTPDITTETGDSNADTLTENNTTLTTSGTLTTTDLDLSDTTASTVSGVVASGNTTGLASDNAALLAMFNSTASVLDATETSDTLTWSFNSGSEHFEYLAAGESLILTYTITVTDSQGTTDSQNVTITVNGNNDLPVITVETGDSSADSLTETDTTLSTSGTLTVSDMNLSDTVTSAVSGVVASGTTTGLPSDNAALLSMLNSTPNVIDGTEDTNQLTWTFNSAGEFFDYLATGESLTLTYTITVTDSQGATDTQNVIITINGTNDAPDVTIGGGSAAVTLTETDTTLSSTGTLTVDDLDLSDNVTSTVSSVVAGGTTAGMASDNAALLAMLTSTANVIDGTELTDTLTWNFNSASEAFDHLAVGEALTLTYTITVTDSQGVTDTQNVLITINGTNDTPDITTETGNSNAETLTENNTTLTTSGTLTTTDLDLSDTTAATVSGVVASGNTTGLASDNAALLAMLSSTASVLDATETSDTLTWSFNSGSEHFEYLAAGESLVLTYTITVTDSQGTTDSQNVTITVNGNNDLPVITVETGDSSADSLTETDTTLSTSGTLTVSDMNLSDTVTSAVSGVVASGTTTGLPSDNAALLSMLNSTPNVIDGTEDTNQLTWTFNSAGEFFDYLATGESLTLTYTITVTDSQGATDTQNVVITINGTNDAPVITIEPGDSTASAITESNTGLTDSGTLTITDLDRTDNVTAAVNAVSVSGTGIASLPPGLDNTTLESYLSLTPSAILDGTETSQSLTWNFNSGSEAFDFLATGETLILSYTVSVTDDDGAPLTDTETITVTITGSNDAPVITDGPDTLALTETNSGLTGLGSLTIGDVDMTDTVTAAVDSLTVSGTGAGSVPGSLTNTMMEGFLSVSPSAILDGTQTSNTLGWSFDSGSEAFDFLASGETLILTYTLSATDDDTTPLSDTETVTVTITGTNDGPVAVIDTATAAEAGGIANGTPGVDPSGNVLDNDTDADISDTKNVSGVVAGISASASGSVGTQVTGVYGAITIDSDGNYTYLVNNANATVQALRTSADTLDDVFTYTVIDSDGAESSQQITITIQGANDTPHDLTAVGMTINENPTNGDIAGKISTIDVDTGDTTTYQLTDDAGGRFDINSSGDVIVINSSAINYEVNSQHDITIEVTDTAGATYLETFTIYINDIDEFDVVGYGDSDGSANEVDENASSGVGVGITVSASDADGTNNTVTHSLIDDAGGRFTINPSTGEIVTSPSAPLNYEVDSSHNVTVRSVSTDGSEVTQTYTIAIRDINEASVANDDSYNTLAGQSVTLTTPDPLGNDTDVDGDELEMFLVTGPSSGTLSIDSNGVITYTPQSGFFGTDTFTYRSDDGMLLSDNVATVSINVQAGGGGSGGGSGSGSGSGSGDGGSGDGGGSGDSGSGDGGSGDGGSGDASPTDSAAAGETPIGGLANDLSGESRGQSDSNTAQANRGQSQQNGDSNEQESTVNEKRDSILGSNSNHVLNSTLRTSSPQSTEMISVASIFQKGLADALLEIDEDSLLSWYALTNPTQHATGETEEHEFMVGGVGTTLGIASIGYVLWALRGGMFVATMYAGIPGWRMLDPTTLLNAYRGDDLPKDRVEEMLDAEEE